MMRPPIGIIPMKLHWEFNFDDPTSCRRLEEINEAIARYGKAGASIPFIWNIEKDLLETIHNPCATTPK